MDQQADGYFLVPQPSPEAPDADGHLGAQRQWAQAGVSDTIPFLVVVVALFAPGLPLIARMVIGTPCSSLPQTKTQSSPRNLKKRA